jgi:hypothetical protein
MTRETKNHGQQFKTRVKALLASADNLVTNKLANSLKLRKACGLDGIQNECLRHLPRSLVHPTYLITSFSYPIFQSLGRKQKL